MDNYIKNYDSFQKKIVYDFQLGYGGIGDCIKFFMHALNLSIKYKLKLCYRKNNLLLEKYIKLKYPKMYVYDLHNMQNINDVNSMDQLKDGVDYIITPFLFYKDFNYECNINANEVFEFTEEIKQNSNNIFIENVSNYISIHLRLGDKFLETDKSFVICKEDVRIFNEEKLFNFIKINNETPILFFCDNNEYKLQLKKRFNNIIITQCNIGHTSLLNTSDKQIMDTVIEFYLLSNSKIIYIASKSGFSFMASKFNNIPLCELNE
jgi:hypothetical protein